VPYNFDSTAAALNADTTYYWLVTIYDDTGAAVFAPVGQFTTTTSATTLTGSKFDLEIDWNNPFNPSLNEITKFRFTSKDVDRKLQLRIFTLSGLLVREWPQQVAIQNAYYTQEWDGKNSNGETVARGIYLVNLLNVGDNVSVTRKVAVVNGKK
jgi:flagellar hook assembly protein FlgD